MWGKLLRAARPRVETADEFLGGDPQRARPQVETADEYLGGEPQRARPRPPRRASATRRGSGWLLLLGGAVVLGLAFLGVWVLWQRPFETYPALDSSTLVRFATDQGLVCQPPEHGSVAVHWTCHSMEGAPRSLEWFDRSNRVVGIDATIGAPAPREEAATWLAAVAELPVPAERRNEVRSWVRKYPSGGRMTLGPVDLSTSPPGNSYALAIDVH